MFRLIWLSERVTSSLISNSAVFIRDDHFENFDQRSWLNAVSPVAAYFPDDFGHHTALLKTAFAVNSISCENRTYRSFPLGKAAGWFPSLEAAVLLDRSGELSRYASALVGGPRYVKRAAGGRACVEPHQPDALWGQSFKSGRVRSRPGFASKAHENLLKLRFDSHEGATDHWPTPSRALEKDISGDSYNRYLACTSSAEPRALCAAYHQTWTWSLELFKSVTEPLEYRASENCNCAGKRLFK